VLNLLKQIDSTQSKIDAAKDKLNSFIMMKRSLSMTVNELTDLNIDVSTIIEKLNTVDTSIAQAATTYMDIQIQCEDQIQQLREQISELELNDTLESPVDFSLSAIKKLPLSASSLKMDVQYFSFGSNQEADTITSIEKYVRESTTSLGPKSGEVAQMASSQVAQQKQKHNLAGTLIITASCSHPNVSLIDPLIIDIDKAIAVWNSTYTSLEDQIDISDPKEVKSLSEKKTIDKKDISIISGASYGSSFVGMVHIIKSEASSTGPSKEETDQIEQKLKLGSWLESSSGGLGVGSDVMNEVKKLLSTQQVSSHISVITMGAIPTIGSSQLSLGVKKLMQPSPDDIKNQKILKTTKSPNSVAEESTDVSRSINMQNKRSESLIGALAEIDQGSNKVLDINSMMNAFENYITVIKDKSEVSGIPINFYLKKITKAQLLKWWINKYYPEKGKIAITPANKTSE
jgi:hypothetical protein